MLQKGEFSYSYTVKLTVQPGIVRRGKDIGQRVEMYGEQGLSTSLWL